MSDETDPKLNGQPQPFRRPVTWGRPPATVFRAGPLPKGGALPPLPEPPRLAPRPARTGPGILSGSMIPRAAPPTAQTQTRAPAPAPQSSPVMPAQPEASPAIQPDLIVRPLPTPEPLPAPSERVPAPRPIVEAAPAVSPTLAAASARGKSSGRLPLYAGAAVAVLAVVAGGFLFLNRPAEVAPAAAPPAPSATAPAPTLVAPAAPVEAAPVEAAPTPA